MTARPPDGTCPIGFMPATFDVEYVAGAVAPFLLSSSYIGETPSLPMIDLALSKEKAVPAQLWGVFYDNWAPDTEEQGVPVFFQGYQRRGPNNERKKIYVSAVTPDLIATKYGPTWCGSTRSCSPTAIRASRSCSAISTITTTCTGTCMSA